MATKLKSKKKDGRPKLSLEDMVFTGWDQLDQLILWATQEYCAEKLGISADTLTRRIKEKFNITFAEYKHKRKETLRINLLKKQYDVAMNGNTTMLIWLGKNELGQSDKIISKNEHTVQDERVKLDMSKKEKLEMLKLFKNKVESLDD